MKSRILLIDDDKTIIKSLTLLLEDSYEVKSVNSGEECANLLSKESFDCIVSDYYMARGDGMSILQKTRYVIPTIIMTGHGSKELFIEFVNNHAFSVIEKPIKYDVLENLIKKALKYKKELDSKSVMARVGAEASHIIHDLNNPLTVLIASIEAAQLNISTTNHVKLYSRLEKVGKKFSDIIGSLKNQVSGEDGIKNSIISFNLLLGGIVEDSSDLLRGRKVVLSVSGATDETFISDPSIIQRAIENLISNSVDAMPDGGNIEILVNSSDRCFNLVVKDNGPGIPVHIVENLFSSRVTTKTQGKGTGIGLFGSKKLLNLIKSDLTLKKTSVNGTEFLLTIAKGH